MAEQKNIFLPLEEVEGLICETYAEKCVEKSKQAFGNMLNETLDIIKYQLDDALASKVWNYTGTILIDLAGSFNDEIVESLKNRLQSPPFGFRKVLYHESPDICQFELQY